MRRCACEQTGLRARSYRVGMVRERATLYQSIDLDRQNDCLPGEALSANLITDSSVSLGTIMYSFERQASYALALSALDAPRI